MVEHSRGRDHQAQQALIARHGDDSAYKVAAAYAWRGENDKAFEWLERAYQQRDGGVAVVAFDPFLADFRTDQRFGAMLKKLKLSE